LAYLHTTDTIQEAIDYLSRNNIFQVPVAGEEGETEECIKACLQVVGCINALQLASLIVFGRKFVENPKQGEVNGVQPFTSNEWKSMTVNDLLAIGGCSISTESPPRVYHPSDSIELLLTPFGKEQIHSVLVHWKSTFKVVTKSDFVRFLLKHSEQLDKNILNKPIRNLGIVREVTHTIDEHEPALEGFKKIFTFYPTISALAVVDRDGKLVDELSAADLRGLNVDELKSILLPVREFLKARSSTPRKLCTFNLNDKLIDVMERATDAGVHRVWHVDEKGRATGVISLSDMIRSFIEVRGSQ